jgi:hypothetical protein
MGKAGTKNPQATRARVPAGVAAWVTFALESGAEEVCEEAVQGSQWTKDSEI